MRRSTFYVCPKCGNIAIKVVDSGVSLVCCGEKMQELVPNTTDAAVEKHVPVITVDGASVQVVIGSVEHPMTEEHHIDWIYLVTRAGVQSKCLKPGEKPAASFTLFDDEPVAAYAYCNLHGMWMASI